MSAKAKKHKKNDMSIILHVLSTYARTHAFLVTNYCMCQTQQSVADLEGGGRGGGRPPLSEKR